MAQETLFCFKLTESDSPSQSQGSLLRAPRCSRCRIQCTYVRIRVLHVWPLIFHLTGRSWKRGPTFLIHWRPGAPGQRLEDSRCSKCLVRGGRLGSGDMGLWNLAEEPGLDPSWARRSCLRFLSRKLYEKLYFSLASRQQSETPDRSYCWRQEA